MMIWIFFWFADLESLILDSAVVVGLLPDIIVEMSVAIVWIVKGGSCCSQDSGRLRRLVYLAL